MVDGFIKLVEGLTEPFKTIISIGVTLGALVIIYFLVVGAWKFSTAVNKESKVFDLSKDNSNLVKENEKIKKDLELSSASLESLNTYMYKTNESIRTVYSELRSSNKEEGESHINFFLNSTSEYIYEIVNLLASEVGFNNRKRVSLWSLDESEQQDCLKSIYRSSNFPYAKDQSIHLNINTSIAGRAFRTKQRQDVKDLTTDPDWERFSTKQTYQSIIAFPIGDSRVLTIDYKSEPNDLELEFMQIAVNYLTLIYSYRSDVSMVAEIMDVLNEDDA
ncbi:hypothetical protein [Lysinibacillus fusiformis]|uniref:GAF domain-containing protein n=1 Tax=Lysinibacillus fusiformis TaxID=28031 RepID=UPI002E23487F|nr:hypothetical protein [Lysinibacillus fusiformis]